jgi:hypothetical protein
VGRSAAIYNRYPQLCERSDGLINRSKFNVPLGIESRGFCGLPKAP